MLAAASSIVEADMFVIMGASGQTGGTAALEDALRRLVSQVRS